MISQTKKGAVITGLGQEFIANEGDILPDNTNKKFGYIENGSQIMILMDDDSIIYKIFNEKTNRWIDL